MRRCRYLLRNEDEALDALQDVFLQVLRKQAQMHSRAPSSLLYTIATNVCLNKIRGSKRKPATSSEEQLFEIASNDDFEKRFIASSMIDSLFSTEKESTRTIAVLHYIDKFTLEETAEMVGMSVSGIRKRLRNLRDRGLTTKEVM